MLHCSTLQVREKENWKDWIKTKRDYDIAVASGIGFLVYRDLPLSWSECLKELEEENKEVE